MTQQYSTKAQRITMLVALLLLILVVGKSVAAGTSYAVSEQTNVTTSEENTQGTMIKKMVSEIEDMPWRPVLSFLQ